MRKNIRFLKRKILGLHRFLTSKEDRIHRKRMRSYKDRSCLLLAKSIEAALHLCRDKIPVFIVSYNNGIYVENMVKQLNHHSITPIVIDNNSNHAASLQILNRLNASQSAQIVASRKNFGHQVGFLDPVYSILPEVFAYTDPDLQLNANLPSDFLEILSGLTRTFCCYKAGFALSLLEDRPIIDMVIKQTHLNPSLDRGFTLREWESKYWRKQIYHDELTVYAADIDTTFAVYRKSNFMGFMYDAVRVAGDYEAIHLPWFPEMDLFSPEDAIAYAKGNLSSSIYGDIL